MDASVAMSCIVLRVFFLLANANTLQTQINTFAENGCVFPALDTKGDQNQCAQQKQKG